MPLFKWNSFELSGLNYVLSTYTPPYKYLLLLIPFSAMIIYLGGKFYSALPFFTLLFIFIMNYLSRDSEFSSQGGTIFSDTYMGFWFALGLSLLLLFIKKERTFQQ
jgi:hypothetical protein